MSKDGASATTLPTTEIQATDRHRRTLGDLADLAASIADKGLLHPVVVTPEGRLVAGQRRLEACRSLGWERVPVTVVGSLDSAVRLLEAERDENECRLDMAPSEKVALGKELDKWEAPDAAKRKAATQAKPGEGKVGAGNLPAPKRKGQVRDLVGAAVGLSGSSYQRAKRVVQEAEEGNPVAVEALREMDETGKVTPAYEKVVGKSTKDGKAPTPISGGSRKRAPEELVDRILGKLLPTVEAFEHVDLQAAIATGDSASLRRWDKQLTEIIVPLNRLRGDIRKARS